MASGGTVHSFEIALSDVDRGVYETLSVTTARHPSESDGYLVTRVLAYALEHEEGLTFTGGLDAAEEPALWVRDLTGRLVAWIEVGTPAPERVHRACKAADRVSVWCHKDPEAWWRSLTAARIHAPEKLTVQVVPRALVDWLAARLDRRNAWTISRADGELYVDHGGDGTTARLEVRTLTA